MNADRLLVQYVEDIIDACGKARGFVDDVSFDSFSENPEKQFAVIRALEIVGEAVKHIPETVRVRHPEIPWREVAGMRDKLIHGYFRVNIHLIWQTVQRDLPSLLKTMEIIRSELEEFE